MGATPTVVDNEGASRFEMQVPDGGGGGRGPLLDYVRRGDVVHLVHTEVPQELEGRGYGSALAKAALDAAREGGLKVVPTCPFVRAYVERHQEYADLVADEW